MLLRCVPAWAGAAPREGPRACALARARAQKDHPALPTLPNARPLLPSPRAEAGFSTQTLGLQVLTFCRPNTRTLVTEAPSGSLATPLGPFLPGAVAIPAGFL